MHIAYFFAAVLLLIYASSSIAAGKFIKINLKQATTYIFIVAAIGVIGEIAVGSTYKFLFGQALWSYRLYPLHEGFTSEVAPIIWGSYGLYLYLINYSLMDYRVIKKNIYIFFALETVALEVILNLIYKVWFGKFLFFYYPGDLAHLSSLLGLPFYALTGLVIYKSLDALSKLRKASFLPTT